MDTVTFPDDLQRFMDDAVAKLQPLASPGTPVEYDQSPLTVTKYYAHLAVSEDQLMDAGVIPDTRPPVHVPWRRRLRWRLRARRERLGRRIGSWIAGVELNERDDDW